MRSLLSFILFLAGCISHTPSAANQVMYRDGCVGLHCDTKYMMVRYHDSPQGTWYDIDGRIWIYDGVTWRKL